MKKITLLGMLATLAATSAFAAEQPTPPTGDLPHGKPPMHKMFEHTDANKDGAISKEEWVAKGDKMFTEIDANKDGKVTPEEMKAHHEAKRAEMEKHRTEARGNPEGKPPVDAPKPADKH